MISLPLLMNVLAPLSPEPFVPITPAQLQSVMDLSPVGLLVVDRHGDGLVVVTVNMVARKMQGLRVDGTGLAHALQAWNATPLLGQLHAVMEQGEPLQQRYTLRAQERVQVAWDVCAQRLGHDRIIVTLHDVTEAETLKHQLALAQQALAAAQHELHEQADVFNSMERLVGAGHWRRVEEADKTVLLWSQGLCDIAGVQQQKWMSVDDALSGIVAQDRHLFESARKRDTGGNIEYRWQRPDGQVRWMRSRVSRPSAAQGVQIEMGVVQDVTEEYRTADQLREQLLFIQRIASRIPGFIYQYRLMPNGQGKLQYISDAVRDLMGLSHHPEPITHAMLLGQLDVRDAPSVRRSALVSLRRMLPWQCEYRVNKGDGDVHWHMTNAVPYRESDGAVVLYGFTTDITDRKRSEQQIEQLAFFDALTGLPNRRLLLDRLERALPSCQRNKTLGALLFLDLDNFKDFNDTLGHDMGDKLLSLVATKLLQTVRECDTVSRFGGDEFVIMLETLSGVPAEAAMQAEKVVDKLLNNFKQSFELNGLPYYTTPSIGVTLFGDARLSIDELLKRADLAMYQAKAAGRNTQRFFDPEMQAVVNARSSLESDLRNGLIRGELCVYYQPLVDENGRLKGAEALVRWNHPHRGMVNPIDFISLAEQTGLILPLGQFVLNAASAQLRIWAQSEHTSHLTISVNVSARQFRQPNFVFDVMGALRINGTDPSRLKLELTESLLLGDVEDTVERMVQLKREGVGFSLDDFGTGYSSLSYIKRLPLDQIKIDQSFVRDVLKDPNDAAIVRTILALAKSLDLDVVAEGVENTGQLHFLRESGCTCFQGFLFGRPVPIHQLETLLTYVAVC